VTHDVQPADVYHLVWSLIGWVGILSVLVVAKLYMAVRLANRVNRMCDVAEPLLKMTALHGLITDRKNDKVAEVVEVKAAEVKQEVHEGVTRVEQAARKVVHDLREDLHTAGLKAAAEKAKAEAAARGEP
jgi:hypothetical protein